MEMTVETGSGYRPAAQNRPEDAPIGLIPVDSVFSPIRKVAYKVDNTRVGQITDYDKLSVSIETNGAVSPEDALALAARIMSLFRNAEAMGESVKPGATTLIRILSAACVAAADLARPSTPAFAAAIAS